MFHNTAAQVFNFIVRFKLNHDGNSPTFRLIKDEVGLSSTSVVNYHLDYLEAMGKIRRPRDRRDRAAAIEVVGGKWTFEDD